ncbi:MULTISPECIES: hypothetical protein [unclassified Arthrobacter]|uniref:hypothetical protein n=1 Tax=unclassified Arthrobacter TaxID=235627 RepID=UPI0006F6FEFA|nr:hypothetical protein [Arthrobacter sp. Leaf234]KQN99777.1 hypothetical protein ASF21_13385 [Arthrobacter sp. Leaf234]
MSQTLTVEKRHSAAAFAGNGALAVAPRRPAGLSDGAPASARPEATQKVRTPLSVVPARPSRRRVPFAVFSLLVLAGALAAVLMLNISVSGTQYELVQLRSQQVALSQQNEALVLEIENKEAPQNLAAAATKLGMVSSPTFGTIELDSKKVTGTPEPAKEGPKPEVLIAAPDLVTEQPAPVVVEAPVAADPAPAGAGAADEAADAAADSAAGSTASGTIPGPEQAASDR